jgi:hypothetical protein
LISNITNNLVDTIGALLRPGNYPEAPHDTNTAVDIRRLVETAVQDAFAITANDPGAACEPVENSLPSPPGPIFDPDFVASSQNVQGLVTDTTECPNWDEGGESSNAREDGTRYCGAPRDTVAVGSRDFSPFGFTLMTELDMVSALQQGISTGEYVDPKAIDIATNHAYSHTLGELRSPTTDEFLIFH